MHAAAVARTRARNPANDSRFSHPDNRLFNRFCHISELDPSGSLRAIAMKQLRNNVIRAGLDALYFSGAHHLLRPILAGVGAIFMLHHVRPARDDMF